MERFRFFRFSLLAAILGAPLLLGEPRPAAADPRLPLVPVAHRLPPPLRVKVWTTRGPDALYFPGERVGVRFTVNDDAYVCVYNIDTEGHVRVLFPGYGDDGFVHAREVVTLPGPYADFDYVVTGPPGIETVEAIASRAPLTDWDRAWEDEDVEYDDEDYQDDDEDDLEDDDGDDDGEWEEDDDGDGDDERWEDEDDEDGNGTWGADHRLDSRPIPRPRSAGVTVSGDPFVAIRRVNRRLLPSSCEDRDYDTAYVSFCVGERVSYPRYTCNDCHGPYHGYDPYLDHCSVFSVRVNIRWGYPRHHVYVVHRHVLEPRYIYVRHKRVPSHYQHIKRTWTSHESSRLKKEFYGSPAWKAGPKIEKRERIGPPRGRVPGKTKVKRGDRPTRDGSSTVWRNPARGDRPTREKSSTAWRNPARGDRPTREKSSGVWRNAAPSRPGTGEKGREGWRGGSTKRERMAAERPAERSAERRVRAGKDASHARKSKEEKGAGRAASEQGSGKRKGGGSHGKWKR